MMGCVAGDYNITADQGATFSFNLHWFDPDGTPKDITDYTARMQVRQRYVSTSTVLSLTSPSGGITLGGGSGSVVVTASATAMADIAASDYLYDLEMVASNGIVTRLVKGSFTVRPEVTR
jgi:hypothetical protein